MEDIVQLTKTCMIFFLEAHASSCVESCVLLRCTHSPLLQDQPEVNYYQNG